MDDLRAELSSLAQEVTLCRERMSDLDETEMAVARVQEATVAVLELLVERVERLERELKAAREETNELRAKTSRAVMNSAVMGSISRQRPRR